jgi:hypothetical protein
MTTYKIKIQLRPRLHDSDGQERTRGGINYLNAATHRWPVVGINGDVAIHERIEWPLSSKPRKAFRWRHADGTLSHNGDISSTDRLYGLELVTGQRKGLLVEGERCADAARPIPRRGTLRVCLWSPSTQILVRRKPSRASQPPQVGRSPTMGIGGAVDMFFLTSPLDKCTMRSTQVGRKDRESHLAMSVSMSESRHVRAVSVASGTYHEVSAVPQRFRGSSMPIVGQSSLPPEYQRTSSPDLGKTTYRAVPEPSPEPAVDAETSAAP